MRKATEAHDHIVVLLREREAPDHGRAERRFGALDHLTHVGDEAFLKPEIFGMLERHAHEERFHWMEPLVEALLDAVEVQEGRSEQRMHVPAPRLESTLRAAPISAARWRMMRSPAPSRSGRAGMPTPSSRTSSPEAPSRTAI